jgi:DNA-binding NarL/FixJ family response regulator
MAIVDDFEQVAALLRGQWRQPPVIEDQKLDTGEALEEAYIPSVAARQCKCVEQAWYAIIEHRSIITACARSLFETLTSRQRDILAPVGAGLMNKQIAGEIGIAESWAALLKRESAAGQSRGDW